MSVLEQLRYGLGDSPSRVVATNRRLTPIDLRRVAEARGNITVQDPPEKPGPHEIWPLISHHGFNRSSLFGLGERGDIHQKTLTLLLAHDGLVAADPLIDIERAWLAGDADQSLAALQAVVEQVAKVEPLIEKKHLRFEASRPALTDHSRKSILDLFGLSPDLLVFDNFEQAFQDAQWRRGDDEISYVKQARELFRLLNIEAPPLDSAEDGRAAITELASAVIHVSWQLAVCAQDPSCDLTLTRNLEHRIFDELIVRATGQFDVSESDRKRGKTRYVKRLAIGDLPNLSAVGLSIPDAVALRRDNAFENFRTELRGAMKHLPEPTADGQIKSEAKATFEEQMREAARTLRESVIASSFRGRVKHGSVPAAVGFVSSAAFAAPAGITPSVFAGLATYAGVTFTQWSMGRSRIRGANVALRYFSSLGHETP
jgi:hypothetical protein